MWMLSRLSRRYRLYAGRLLTAPAARVIGHTSGRSLVAIDGLFCGVCAARTRRALARMHGVAAVEVDLARGLATIEHSRTAVDGRPGVDERALQRALDGVVVTPGLRRRLARWGARLRRQRQRSEQRSAV